MSTHYGSNKLTELYNLFTTPDTPIDVEAFKKEDKVLDQYTIWRTEQYEVHGYRGQQLSDEFGTDFVNFTEETFRAVGTNHITKLRNHLINHGTWVRSGRGVSIAKALVEVLPEYIPWPDNEPKPPTYVYPPAKGIPKDEPKPDPGNGSGSGGFGSGSGGGSDRSGGGLGSDRGLGPGSGSGGKNDFPKPPDLPSHLRRLPTMEEQIFMASQAPSFENGKELIDLAKYYSASPEAKYSGTQNESFELAFTIFLELCQKARVPFPAYVLAFSTMLKLDALQFYYVNLKDKNYTLVQLSNAMKLHFEGPEYARKKLAEWNDITLRAEIRKTPEKAKSEVFAIMIDKLRSMQRSLDPEYRTPGALINKITASVVDMPPCATAVLLPVQNVSALVHNITSSLEHFDAAHKAEKLQPLLPLPDPSTIYYTDRKYRQNSSDRPYRYPRRPPPPPRSRKKICIICKKEGCWSRQHSKKEQADYWNKQRNAAYLLEEGGQEDQEDDGEDDEYTEDLDLEALELDSEKETFLSDTFESFTCCNSSVPADIALAHYHRLADEAIQHALSVLAPQTSNTFTLSGRYGSDIFRGVMLDTGASTISTAGYAQAQAYMRDFNAKMDTSKAGEVTAQFGVGDARSIGKLEVMTPIGRVTFYVMDTDIPFLLCLQDMDRLKVFFNNLTDEVILKDEKSVEKSVPVVRVFDHPFLVWGPTSINYLTEPELRQLHRRFGHPSVNRLVKTLEKAGYEDPDHRHLIQKLTEFCEFCQKHSRSPGRFKFTLKEDIYFNYSLVIDVMYLEGSPVLHVVDEGTTFQAARFLDNMSAKHTWDMLRLCWIDVYTGPPEVIVHDAGTNFDSAEFRRNAATMAIQLKCVPVETPQSVGLVERYHGPLRRAYMILSEELKDQTVGKDIKLQMAVKAVNDTAGYDGLVPTLLVFGAYPRISSSDAPALSTLQRAKAIKLAMNDLSKERAKRQTKDALHQRNGPQHRMQDTPIGSPVLVWRPHSKEWTGPHTLLAVMNEDCTVQLPGGPTTFRSTAVKPYLKETSKDDNNNLNVPEDDEDDTIVVDVPLQPAPEVAQSFKRGRGRPRKNPLPTPEVASLPRRKVGRPRKIYIHATEIAEPPPSPNFEASRRKELDGLLDRGVFRIAKISDIPPGTRIFGSRFVDEVKFKGTEKAFEKSRLVVQAYNDAGKEHILTQAPTIMRASQRLILAFSLVRPDLDIYLRDISQAYTQSTSSMSRDVFIRAPKEMNLGPNAALQVVLPLYGIPEAGTHWFRTYHKHHIDKLGMIPSTFDTCLLYKNDGSALVGLQTDDSLIAATTEFMEQEDAELKKAHLLAKPFEKLTSANPINFNGFIISLIGEKIMISQKKQVQDIQLLDQDFTREQYVSQRARGAYVATVSQPQAAFDLSFAAQTTEPTWEDAQYLNKRLSWQMQGSGLTFVKLDAKSLRILAFVDASFANNKDLTSQLGYVIVLADAQGNANLIHWQSVKCRRVTRSVLASELYALVLGFDVSAVLKSTSVPIFSGCCQDIPLTICTDSHSLYDCLVKLGTTHEKRLMIDILSLRQSYERREITEILWIAGGKNPADAMTKSKPCDALQRLIDTNKLDLQVEKWVERT